MSMRFFSRNFILTQARKIFFSDVRIRTTTANVNLKVLRPWNQQKSWNFAKKYPKTYLIAGIGLFDLFKWSSDEEEKDSELIMTIKRGILCIQREEFQKAEQMLHVALRMAQSLEHYKAVTYIYNLMGDLALQVGEYKKAQDLFTSVMQRLISTGTPQNDPQIVHMSLKIAKIYEQSGDHVMAENGYNFCIENMEAHAKEKTDDEETLMLLATSKDWYARMLMTDARFKEALNNFNEAYETCCKLYGRNHAWTAMLLNDMAMVNCLLGELDKAVEYITEAIDIGQGLEEIDDLSEMYINLGYIYLSKSLYYEANKACLEGLKRAKASGKTECEAEAKTCLAEVKGKL